MRQRQIADRAAAVLSAEPYGSKVAKIIELSFGFDNLVGNYPIYSAAMAAAIESEPPPFDAEAYDALYRESALDARWTAVHLLTNSEQEGNGSRRLWSLASFADHDGERQQLKRHAVDESKHALMYLSLVNLAFPEALEPAFRIELRQLSPGFSMHEPLYPVAGSPYAKSPTIDDFIQMNIAEIRTTIHHVLQRQALAAFSPPQNKPAIKGIQDCLLRDELAHVSYTAGVIERRARDVDFDKVKALFRKRLRDFNRITREGLGENAFDCSASCCAKREWCLAKASGAQPNFHDFALVPTSLVQ